MKSFKQYVKEARKYPNPESNASPEIGKSLEKHGFKDTVDRRGWGGERNDPVYTPTKPTKASDIAAIAAKHGFKRVTHYARGGPDSRMPDSAPHCYTKSHGYAGTTNLTVNHENGMVKHILHGHSRSRD